MLRKALSQQKDIGVNNLAQDVKYRGPYEVNLLTNPSIRRIVWKVLVLSLY